MAMMNPPQPGLQPSRLSPEKTVPSSGDRSVSASKLPAQRLRSTIEDLKIPETFLANLFLKHAFYLEIFLLSDLTTRLKLNSAIVLHLIDNLRREKYLEVRGSGNLNGSATAISQNYRYCLTESGKRRTAQIFEFDSYVGPAPVSLEEYWQQVEGQSIGQCRINRQRMMEGFKGLIIAEALLDQLGQAVTSGKPLFLYGPPGNGKTAVSLRLGTLMDDTIMVPYALYVEGNIIRIFDAVTHNPVSVETESLLPGDLRWVHCRRPAVLVGGEMTLEMLDLTFNPLLRYYEAPLQLKANNGIFIVDDFGRQRIAPQEMLNRWIIPMENRRDYLCLHTGHKFAIPFDQMLIFSTNLEPETLLDTAFLRRLRHKIKLNHIDREQFLAIFRLVCEKYQIEYDEELVNYLLAEHYDPYSRPLDACHPRDIVEHIIDISRYFEVAVELTRENIDRACKTYFVD